MEAVQQHKLDTLTRCQEFMDAHEAELGPFKDTEARRQLDAAVGQVAVHRHAQLETENARRVAHAGKNAAALALQEQMKPIAKFARAKLPGVADFAAMSESGLTLHGAALVSAGRAMAAAVVSVQPVLLEAQFPADVVQQLNEAADELENALNAHAARKMAKGVATASLRQRLEEGRKAVALLDPIVTKKLAGNAGLLEGWRQAKRVVKKPGVVGGATSGAAPAQGVGAASVVPVAPGGPVAVVQPGVTGSVTTSGSTPQVGKETEKAA